MATTGQHLIRVVVLAAISVIGRSAAADEPLALAVVLENQASLSDSDVTAAEQHVTAVFQSTGITVQWLHDTERPVSTAAGVFVPHVILAARPVADRFAGRNRDHDVLGVSVAPARLAYVFANRILMMSLSRGTSFSRALGYVIAHELGHLLLPGQGHTAAGLMSSNIWGAVDESGGLNDAQGAAIRDLLRASKNWNEMDLARELWARVSAKH
jgi:hypothetical protein